MACGEGVAGAADSRPTEAARTPSSWGPLLWILVFGAIVRLAVWGLFAGADEQIVDAQDYDRLAVGLVETGSYVTPAGNLSSLRPPLYPWCVSIGYRLFGIQNFEAIRLGQAALSLLTVVIVFRIGALAFSERVGLLGAAAYCFYPSALGFNNLILSETLFTFLVTLSVWLVAEAIARESLGWLLTAGLVLGLGALVRSILWLFAPALAVLLLFLCTGTVAKRLAMSAGMLVAFAITISPWAYRNTQVQKTLTLIDVMGGRNVMMGNYEHTPLERSWATIELVQGDRSWISVLRAEHGSLQGLTQGQIDKLAMRHGVRYMVEHPGVTLQRSLVRGFNFWQLDRTLIAGMQSGFWGQVSKPVFLLIAIMIVGYYAALAFAALFGIVFAQPRDWRFHILLLANIGFPWLVHSAIFAHSRYHLPVMPLACLYLAVAFVSLVRIQAERPRWRLWLACGLCAVLCLAWGRELWMVDLAQMSSRL
ncbi:ArnT family glycosyltransferase [Candidatus Laterigemmans baculatus]|uniref:ArnT family glycosyltransferase n=1 Tax=Candidatus Laterigemmans baculatus TaxID=2770505 RepID=UPI0013DB8CE4|nr:glycosyltransferase family 39 protein [Candidatus Laterigemmans baculatus]